MKYIIGVTYNNQVYEEDQEGEFDTLEEAKNHAHDLITDEEEIDNIIIFSKQPIVKITSKIEIEEEILQEN